MVRLFKIKKIALTLSIVGFLTLLVIGIQLFYEKNYNANQVKIMVGSTFLFVFGFTFYASYGKTILSWIGMLFSFFGLFIVTIPLWIPEIFKIVKPFMLIIPSIALLLAIMIQINQADGRFRKLVLSIIILFGTLLTYACLFNNFTSIISCVLTILLTLIVVSGTFLVFTKSKNSR